MVGFFMHLKLGPCLKHSSRVASDNFSHSTYMGSTTLIMLSGQEWNVILRNASFYACSFFFFTSVLSHTCVGLASAKGCAFVLAVAHLNSTWKPAQKLAMLFFAHHELALTCLIDEMCSGWACCRSIFFPLWHPLLRVAAAVSCLFALRLSFYLFDLRVWAGLCWDLD